MATIVLHASTAAVVPSVTNSSVHLEVIESFEQMTLPAGGTIKAGAPVRVNSSGQFVECDGTTAGNADAYGIATKRAVVGEAVTAIKRGVLGGFVFTQAYWSNIFISDTAGVLADAAGTVSKIVGKIIPVPLHLRGGSPLKALMVNL